MSLSISKSASWVFAGLIAVTAVLPAVSHGDDEVVFSKRGKLILYYGDESTKGEGDEGDLRMGSEVCHAVRMKSGKETLECGDVVVPISLDKIEGGFALSIKPTDLAWVLHHANDRLLRKDKWKKLARDIIEVCVNHLRVRVQLSLLGMVALLGRICYIWRNR